MEDIQEKYINISMLKEFASSKMKKINIKYKHKFFFEVL